MMKAKAKCIPTTIITYSSVKISLLTDWVVGTRGTIPIIVITVKTPAVVAVVAVVTDPPGGYRHS